MPHTVSTLMLPPMTQGGSPGTHLGGIPVCTDTPSRRLLLRAVRILLECILVMHKIQTAICGHN